jgi:purine-binding chemotaxis protein CheW
MEEAKMDSGEMQYLTFVLGREIYGLPISSVREVFSYHRISKVPLVCETIRGVMNLRGNVITVIDLSARLYGKRKPESEKGVVVIAEVDDDGQSAQIGMLIDAVSEVVDLGEDDMEDEPSFGAKIRSDFISRIGKHNGKFIIILNSSKVLHLEELSGLTGMSIKDSAAAVRA